MGHYLPWVETNKEEEDNKIVTKYSFLFTQTIFSKIKTLNARKKESIFFCQLPLSLRHYNLIKVFDSGLIIVS